MKRVFTFIVLIGLLVPSAQAGFVMRLTDLDNAVSVTITDDGVGDAQGATPGAITFVGAVGEWNINVTTGVSKPVLPASPPRIDLNSIDTTSLGGPATLLIELTDTGFVVPANGNLAVLLSEIGGTTDGTVEFNQYLDRGNAEFGYLDYVVPQGPFGPGAFSGTASAATPVLDGVPFSITEYIVIEHFVGDFATSFNASSTVVPVPGAVLLGMLGLSAAGIKLRRRA